MPRPNVFRIVVGMEEWCPPLRPAGLTEPLESRLSSFHPHREAILDRHAIAVSGGSATYVDPVTGLSVFTSRFLAERRYCCGNGCRHCPYVQPDSL